MNVWFSFIKEIHASVEARRRGFDFHAGGNVENNVGVDIPCHYFRRKILSVIHTSFLARRKANSGYEIEICPRHQILVWGGVYAGVKPFMKWTPS